MNGTTQNRAKQHQKVINVHVNNAKTYQTWQEKYFSGVYPDGVLLLAQKQWQEYLTVNFLVEVFHVA